eukprot:6037605-Prymnesium_polylepis.2
MPPGNLPMPPCAPTMMTYQTQVSAPMMNQMPMGVMQQQLLQQQQMMMMQQMQQMQLQQRNNTVNTTAMPTPQDARPSHAPPTRHTPRGRIRSASLTLDDLKLVGMQTERLHFEPRRDRAFPFHDDPNRDSDEWHTWWSGALRDSQASGWWRTLFLPVGVAALLSARARRY